MSNHRDRTFETTCPSCAGHGETYTLGDCDLCSGTGLVSNVERAAFLAGLPQYPDPWAASTETDF